MVRQIVRLTVLGAAIVGAVACSSSDTQDKGVEGPGTGSTESAKNPYGVEYPTKNIGLEPRKGSIPGNVMKNYKFRGIAHADANTAVDPSAELTTVSLADYFDPETRNFKVIHLNVASVWCPPCNAETEQAVAQAAKIAGLKVAFVQVLADGPVQGTGATVQDLQFWIKKHNPKFPQLLDPDLKNLGQFFDAAAVPWNADLDARTMEILSAGTGAPPDLEAEVSKWASWVDSNPPSEF